MKTLVVEDDFTSSLLLREILKHYGPAHTALNGQQAVDARPSIPENRTTSSAWTS
jgi:CheY-like chemotaxis protein